MKHLPSDFRWSFSKLASFKQCPYSFYLTYIQNNAEEEIDNYFAQYGSFAHKLLEGWAKDEIPSFCLADEWRDGYEAAVTMPPPPFPKGMAEKYYIAGEQYFESFDGFGDEWRVLSAEKKFVLTLDRYTVSGIADLVLQHRDTGELWVIDHKSKSMNSLKKELNVYRKQLYLYAMWCMEAFGRYPDKISFNMFKENKFVDEVFSMSELEETKKWFVDTIREIEACDVLEDWDTCISDQEYDQAKESYFCKNICSINTSCERFQDIHYRAIEEWKARRAMEEAMCFE